MRKEKIDEKWYQRTWRPASAFIYLAICVFDFMVMPSISALRQREYNQEVFERMLEVNDPEIRQIILNKVNFTNGWDPLTLRGSGLFHISFGAILTGAAISRTREKKYYLDNYEEEYYNYGNNGHGRGRNTSHEREYGHETETLNINKPKAFKTKNEPYTGETYD